MKITKIITLEYKHCRCARAHAAGQKMLRMSTNDVTPTRTIINISSISSSSRVYWRLNHDRMQQFTRITCMLYNEAPIAHWCKLRGAGGMHPKNVKRTSEMAVMRKILGYSRIVFLSSSYMTVSYVVYLQDNL